MTDQAKTPLSGADAWELVKVKLTKVYGPMVVDYRFSSVQIEEYDLEAGRVVISVATAALRNTLNDKNLYFPTLRDLWSEVLGQEVKLKVESRSLQRLRYQQEKSTPAASPEPEKKGRKKPSQRALTGTPPAGTIPDTPAEPRTTVVDEPVNWGEPTTLDFMLRRIAGDNGNQLTLTVFQCFLASVYKVKRADILARHHVSAYTKPQQRALYLAKNFSDRSNEDIARAFNRSVNSVITISTKIARLRLQQPELNRELKIYEKAILRWQAEFGSLRGTKGEAP